MGPTGESSRTRLTVPKFILIVKMSAAAPEVDKCCFRSCARVPKAEGGTAVVSCMAVDCEKKIHVGCCEKIRQQYKLNTSVQKGNEKSQPLYYCTKKCHDKILKEGEGGSRLPWSQDGPGGKQDSTGNSERLLLDWLLTGDNYASYCGPKNGETKQKVATRISNMLKSKGVLVERSPKSIISKIEGIEQQFKTAYEWTNNTGVGVKETNEAQFWEYVEKLCPYFRDLEPVMGKRSKMKALATNEDLLGLSLDCDSLGVDDNSDDDSDDDSNLVSSELGSSSGCKDKDAETASSMSKDSSSTSSPLSLRKKRNAKAAASAASKKRKKTPTTNNRKQTNSQMWDDDPFSVMIALKKREQKWSQKEQEQEFKMKSLSRVKELLSMDLSGDQIVRLLGEEVKPILNILDVAF